MRPTVTPFDIFMWMMFTILLCLAVGADAQELSPNSPVAAPSKPSTLTVLTSAGIRIHRSVQVIGLEGFNDAEKERMQKLAGLLEQVINSDALYKKVLAHRVPIKGQPYFWDVSSPLAMTAVDAFSKTMSDTWMMHYQGYESRSSTVGYTYPNVKWIKLNKRHKNFKDNSLVIQNMCHEFGGHKRGFRHAGKPNSMRPYSYPYALGKMCREVYLSMFEPGRTL